MKKILFISSFSFIAVLALVLCFLSFLAVKTVAYRISFKDGTLEIYHNTFGIETSRNSYLFENRQILSQFANYDKYAPAGYAVLIEESDFWGNGLRLVSDHQPLGYFLQYHHALFGNEYDEVLYLEKRDLVNVDLMGLRRLLIEVYAGKVTSE